VAHDENATLGERVTALIAAHAEVKHEAANLSTSLKEALTDLGLKVCWLL
jgi:hypothetical protein